MGIFITLINLFVEIITLLILVHVILSFIVSPFHPIRQALDRIVRPMLDPIRRLLPPTGMLDLSPIVLILVLYLLRSILVGLLR